MTYFGTRLSENISRRDPEGYLICVNVPVARTGVQEYLPSELGLPDPDDRLISVRREESEVFSPACMASFEGMPVTDDHPSAPEGVTVENSRYLEKGHVQNVRRGAPPEEDLLLADLIIKDPRLIEKILSGKREISCGYNYVLSEEDGSYFQREIRGNHVAVVDSGRAGPRVSIRDQKECPHTGTASSPDRISFHSHSFSQPVSQSQLHTPSGGSAAGADNERSTQMNRKNHWRAKLMARMARDGDVESLAEMITELMETPDPLTTAPAGTVGAAIAAPAVLPLQAASAMDPVVSAVVQAVEAPAEATPVTAVPVPVTAAPVAAIPVAATAPTVPVATAAATIPVAPMAGGAPVIHMAPMASVPESPVEVTAPADQPVLVDCGPDILAALNRIIELLTAFRGADCGDPARQGDCGGSARQGNCGGSARQADETPTPAESAVSASTPAETANAANAVQSAAAAEVVETAAEVAEAVIQAMSIEADPAAGGDPVEELVAEILEAADPTPASPVEEAVQAEILSGILEPEAGDAENGDHPDSENRENGANPDGEDPEDSENAARAADALRTALAAFRPQLQRMSPQDRQRFNADVAARMRKLTARSGKDRNPYAAIRGGAARPRDDRALGQKIMAARNANRKH